MRLAVILQVARHQMRDYVRDWRIVSVTLLFLCLYGLCLWSSWNNTQATRAAGTRLEQDERRRWLNQGSKSPHGAADQGIVTLQPLSNLAAFDPGLLPFAGLVCRLEGHHEDLCMFRPAADAGWLSRISPVSPARLIQVFAPLLLLLLTYPLISAERESGILKQILASGVSSGALAAGKAMAVAALLAPVVAIVLAGPMLLAGHDWGRVATLVLAYAAFLCGLGGVFLATAMRSSGPGLALARIAVCWFAAAFLGPVIAAQFAERMAPAPLPTEWNSDLKEQATRVPTVEERRKSVRARLLEQYSLTNLRDLPVNPIGVELVEEDVDLQEIWAVGIDKLFHTYATQDRIYGIAGLLDPVLAIQTLSSAVAETDNVARDRFRQAAEEYRHGIVLKMNDYLVHDPDYHRNPVYIGTDIIVSNAGPALWETIPPFRYEVPGFNPFTRSIWSVASLILWLLVGVGSTWIAARRLRAA